MRPSFKRTPSSFRDGLEVQGIAMPFARGQIVASCEFLKQFDSQAKFVLWPANARGCPCHCSTLCLAFCLWRGIVQIDGRFHGADQSYWC